MLSSNEGAHFIRRIVSQNFVYVRPGYGHLSIIMHCDYTHQSEEKKKNTQKTHKLKNTQKQQQKTTTKNNNNNNNKKLEVIVYVLQ